MKITFEEHDIRPGAEYQFQTGSGTVVTGTILFQDWTRAEERALKPSHGATTEEDQQVVVCFHKYRFIGPFANKKALADWMNASGRAGLV